MRLWYALAIALLALGSAADAACISPPRDPVQAALGWPGMKYDMQAITTVTDLNEAQMQAGGYGSSAPVARAHMAASQAQQDLLKQQAEAAKCR